MAITGADCKQDDPEGAGRYLPLANTSRQQPMPTPLQADPHNRWRLMLLSIANAWYKTQTKNLDG